jgi:hypothetical protein
MNAEHITYDDKKMVYSQINVENKFVHKDSKFSISPLCWCLFPASCSCHKYEVQYWISVEALVSSPPLHNSTNTNLHDQDHSYSMPTQQDFRK